MSNAQPVAAVAVVCVATALFSVYGLRPGRATSDFYVASRAVSPLRNASAIGGEYLSAASFLGIAGLVLAFGADMLWYGVGYTAGYLVLLAFVAAPLRRSGAYTVPDFAEARLESTRVRRLTALLVVFTGWLYLLPQLQGAGLTLRTVTGAPLGVGPVVVTAVVMVTVASGGMRSVTFVQAFQYWLKLTALAVPVIFLLLAWRADGAPWPGGDAPPRFREATTVSVQQSVRVQVDEPVTVTVRGSLDGQRVDGTRVRLEPGEHRIGEGARVAFPAGADVPHPEGQSPRDGRDWSRPLSGTDHPVYGTYSLLVATLLGTMGLPHVIVRYYTNPDGAAARRTTWAVLWLLAAFYVLPPVYGAQPAVHPRTAHDRPYRRGRAAARPAGGRDGRGTAGHAADRGRVRGIPVDSMRTDRLGGWSARAGTGAHVVGGPGTSDTSARAGEQAAPRQGGASDRGPRRAAPAARGRGCGLRAMPAVPRRRAPGSGGRRRAGVRGGRVDVLAVAAPGHLVAATHPAGRTGGPAGRRRDDHRRGGRDHGRRAARGVDRGDAEPTGGLERAPGVRGDDRDLLADPSQHPSRHRTCAGPPSCPGVTGRAAPTGLSGRAPSTGAGSYGVRQGPVRTASRRSTAMVSARFRARDQWF
jgi:sodium:solute symporter family protein